MSKNFDLLASMSMSTADLVAPAKWQDDHTRRMQSPWKIGSRARGQIALVACGAVLLTIAITRQSLWIDEAWTAWFAAHASIRSLFHALAGSSGSDAQMPGYLLYMHAWVGLFGRSEIALRFANLPFAVLLLSSLSWCSTVLLKRPYAWVIVILSPFLWFYMNEGRPYVLLMAGSSVVAASVLTYCMEQPVYDRIAPWMAMASFTITLAFYMLAAFLGPIILLFLVLSVQGRWRRLLSDWRRPALVFLPLIVAMVAYYAWTMFRGAGGARGETGLRNIAFVLYEFCGFVGLGPPRNELRASGGAGVLAYWPMAVFGSVAFLSVLVAVAIASRRKLDKDFALSVAAAFAIAVLACKIVHFQFVGRHFAAFYPFALLALLMNTQVRNNRRSRRIVTGAFTLLAVGWAVSDARLILLSSYGKEDYRDAAAVAIEQVKRDGGTILWAADGAAAYYYGLNTDDPSQQRDIPGKIITSEADGWPIAEKAVFAANWTSERICRYATRSSLPIILVLATKPDLFDRSGAWAWWIRQPEMHATPLATFNGFAIYKLWLEKGHSLDCVQKISAPIGRRPLFTDHDDTMSSSKEEDIVSLLKVTREIDSPEAGKKIRVPW